MGTHIKILGDPNAGQHIMSEAELLADNPAYARMAALSRGEMIAYFTQRHYIDDHGSPLENGLEFYALIQLAFENREDDNKEEHY